MRTITRTVRRQIGRLTVQMGRDGIRVSLFRSRRSWLLRWSDIASAIPARPRNGCEAFGAAVHPGWLPAVGDRVWCHAGGGRIRRGRIRIILPAVPGPIYRVRLAPNRVAGQRRAPEIDVLRIDLRPRDAALTLRAIPLFQEPSDGTENDDKTTAPSPQAAPDRGD